MSMSGRSADEVFDEDNSKSLSLKEFKRACRIYGFRGHLCLVREGEMKSQEIASSRFCLKKGKERGQNLRKIMDKLNIIECLTLSNGTPKAQEKYQFQKSKRHMPHQAFAHSGPFSGRRSSTFWNPPDLGD